MLEFHDILKVCLEEIKKDLPWYEIADRIIPEKSRDFFWKIRSGERPLHLKRFKLLLTLLAERGFDRQVKMLVEWVLPPGFEVVKKENSSSNNEIQEAFDVIYQAGDTIRVLSECLRDGRLVPYEKKQILSSLSILEKEIEELKECLK